VRLWEAFRRTSPTAAAPSAATHSGPANRSARAGAELNSAGAAKPKPVRPVTSRSGLSSSLLSP